MVKCRRCSQYKLLTEFYLKDKNTNRYSTQCKVCDLEDNCIRRQNPEFKQRMRERRFHRYHTDENYREKIKLNNNDSYHRLRVSVINKYGEICGCCGECNFEFLSIDHIQGGGSRELSTVGLKKFLRNLRDSEISSDYRVLCRNCNQSLGYYGYCPHTGNKCNEVAIETKWRKRYVVLRKSVLDLYGGCCQCCGINYYEFLAIDHVLENGAEERRKITPERFLSKLLSIGRIQPDYRLLCHNCNSSLWYNGYCPHKF